MSQVRPDDHVESYGGAPSQFGNNGRRFGPRNSSDPALYGYTGQQGVYPSHGHQQSYDTVNTASNGSYATDPWVNTTDPSSENSSIDRFPPGPKADAGEAHGFIGFSGGPQFQGPILEEHGSDAPGYGQPGYGRTQTSNTNGNPYQGNGVRPNVPPHGPPRLPPKDVGSRGPIQLSAPAVNGRTPPRADKSEKRKSWIKKRFSKS